MKNKERDHEMTSLRDCLRDNDGRRRKEGREKKRMI
jgi:hypothetical protein